MPYVTYKPDLPATTSGAGERLALIAVADASTLPACSEALRPLRLVTFRDASAA